MAISTSEKWSSLFDAKNAKREHQFDIGGTIYGAEEENMHAVQSGLYDKFGIGYAKSARLTLSVFADEVPSGAAIQRYVRLSRGGETSEWIPAGVFFINQREENDGLWEIEAYDAMRKAEFVWIPDQSLVFPMTMPDAVSEFCRLLDLELDERTVLNEEYTIDYPANEYTIRSILKYIGAAHGGNWCITPEGKLRLVSLIQSGEVHNIGNEILGLKDNGLRKAVSRVTLWVDSSSCLTSGDDSGYEIEADCPYATQSMVDNLAAELVGYQYHAYYADAAELDPAAELGDSVSVGGFVSVVASISDDGCGYPDISAPGEKEIEEEFPYSGPLSQTIDRKIAQTRSEISKTSEEIRLLVEREVGDLADKYTELAVTVDGVTVTTTNEDGTKTITLKNGIVTADAIAAGAITAEKLAAGAITADSINLAGAITWNDLSAGLQSTVNSAYAKGESAETIAKQIAAGTYSGGTFIDGTTIYSPIIQGAQIRATKDSGTYGEMQDDRFCIFNSEGTEIIRLHALDNNAYYTQFAMGEMKRYAGVDNYAGCFLIQQIDAPAASRTLIANTSPTGVTAGLTLEYGTITVLGNTFDFNGATVTGFTAVWG